MCHKLVSSADLVHERGVTVSNNFTKRRQNGFKIGTRDKFATHLRQENLISNEIVIYMYLHIFLRSLIFPYNSLHSQAVAYTTYFEPGSLSIYMSKSGNLICSCLGSNKSFVLVNGKRLFIYLLKENFKLSFRNIYSSLEWNTIRCRTEWAVTVQHSRLYRKHLQTNAQYGGL